MRNAAQYTTTGRRTTSSVVSLTLVLVVVLGALAVYAMFVGTLVLLGRRQDARAVAGFVPDCAILVGRLLRDRRVPRRHKILLGLLVAYLAMPLDLVPDFIPVAGQLDDAIFVLLVLRTVLRHTPAAWLAEHWPGPQSSLERMLRLSRGGTAGSPEPRQ